MPKRFFKTGDVGYETRPATEAQAWSLYPAHSLHPHSADSYKMEVATGCASPDFIKPPQAAHTHLQAYSANPIAKRTGVFKRHFKLFIREMQFEFNLRKDEDGTKTLYRYLNSRSGLLV